MLRVADVSEFYAERGGGVKTYTDQKLEAARDHDVDLTVIAPGPEDRVQARLGGRIVWVKGPPMPLDPRYHVMHREGAVHERLRECGPHVIEGSSPWTGGWFAARFRPTEPTVKAFVFHQDPVAVYGETLLHPPLPTRTVNRAFAWYWAYLRRLSQRYSVTVTSGPWLARKLHRLGLRDPRSVPFGIERSLFSPDRHDSTLRAEWLERCGLRPDAHLVITVSRHHPEKRLSTLARIIEGARSSGAVPIGWVVVGDGPLRNFVEGQVRQVGQAVVAGRLRRDKLTALMASADALLHGSAAETFGLVVAEALCSGLGIVVPDRGGAADLAGPGYAERYRAGDATDGAAALLRLLHIPRDERLERATQAARSRVHTVERHFANLFHLYGKLYGELSDRTAKSA